MAAEPADAPAEGERRAVRGFGAQYRVAARLILERLEVLESVRLVDPETGRVDDVVIDCGATIEGVQVKWAAYPDSLTFNGLLAASDAGPSLLAQLLDGWQRLRATYPHAIVRVALVTNSRLSVADKVNAPDGDEHTYAFYDEAWNKPRAERDARWNTAIEKVRLSLGLDSAQFEAFRESCNWRHGIRPDEIGLGPAQRSDAVEADEIESLAEWLFRQVEASKSRSPVVLTRAQIVEVLEGRPGTRGRHIFPIDGNVEPNAAMRAKLNDMLDTHRSGYVALRGTPGSGKSTALTDLFRDRALGRVVRYYVYVPETANETRSEAEVFLRELIAALREHGFTAPRVRSREQAQSVLTRQLEQAAQNYEDSGVRTFILVDGLDHAGRDTEPHRNLLRDLPSPEALKDGVLIALGSQTLELEALPPAIRAHFEADPSRTVEMEMLSRAECYAFAQRALGSIAISAVLLERLYARTAGHPLALQLSVARIRQRGEAKAEDIDAFEIQAGNVRTLYHRLWNEISADPALRELVALASRLRGPVDFERLLSWFGDSAMERFRATCGHLFRQVDGEEYEFFHDSLRHDLRQRSSLDGLKRPTLEPHWHGRLADRAREANDAFRFEELHHRFRAGQDAQVLALAVPARFREQFCALRPLPRLREDIHAVLQVAGRAGDGLLVFRALLIESELLARADALNDVDLPLALYRARGVPAISRYLSARGPLASEKGLVLALRLWKDGHGALARRVFELCEPLELLHGLIAVTQRPEAEKLHAWARVAWRFRSLPDLLQMCRAIRMRGGEEEPGTSLHDELTATVGNAMRRAGAAAQLNALLALLDADVGARLMKDLRDRALSEGDSTGIDPLAAITEAVAEERQDPDVHWRILLASRALSLANDPALARSILGTVPELELPAKKDISTLELDRVAIPYLQMWRAHAALDAHWMWDAVVADSSFQDFEFDAPVLRRYFRLLARLAYCWGRAWAGERWEPLRTRDWLAPVWRQLGERQPRNRTSDWLAAVRRSGESLLKSLFHCAAAHGVEAANATVVAAQDAWRHPPDGTCNWPFAWRIVTVIASEWTVSPAERRNLLNALEHGRDAAASLAENLEQQAALSEAYAVIGETHETARVFAELLTQSFGIHHDKDYQTQSWSEYLLELVQRAPQPMCSALLGFAGRLSRAAEFDAGRGYQEAFQNVVRAGCAVSPAMGLALWDACLKAPGARFNSCGEGLVLGLLDRKTDPIWLPIFFLVNVIAPFSENADESVIDVLGQWRHSPGVRSRQSHLERSLTTRSLPRVADRYRKALSADVATRDEDESSAHESKVELADGRELTQSALASAAASVDALIALMRLAKSPNGYAWEKAVVRAASIADATQAVEMADLLPAVGLHPRATAALLRRLAALGADNRAIALAEQLLASSADGGWIAWYDGAPRLHAFRALIEISAEYRRRALEDFVDCHIEGGYRIGVEALADIESILFTTPPTQALWSEVEDYLSYLWPYSLGTPVEVQLAEVVRIDDAIGAASAALLRIPVPFLQHRVRDLLVESAAAAPAALLAAVRALLDGDDRSQRMALGLLFTMRQHCGVLPADARSIVAPLVEHPHYGIRWLAGALEPDIARTDAARPLPASYALHLPPLAESSSEGLHQPQDPISDLEPHADVLMRVFGDAVRALSEASGTADANIAYRVGRILDDWNWQPRWGAKAEKALVSRMTVWEMRASWRRLRVEATRDALARVSAELLDAQRLEEPLPEEARVELLAEHQIFSGLRYNLRPASVDVPEALCGYGNYHSPVLAASGVRTLADGRLVVSERSTFLGGGWGERTIERSFSAVADPTLARYLVEEQIPILRTPDGRFATYPRLTKKLPIIAVVLQAAGLETEVEDCIALNPVLAAALRWHPDPTRLFGWLDADGEAVAESFCWAEGPAVAYHHDSHPCGVGSMLVVTTAGWARIRGLLLNGVLVSSVAETNRESKAGSVRVETIGSVASSDRAQTE